LELDEVKFNL